MNNVLKSISCLLVLICFSFVLTACNEKTNNSQPPNNSAIEQPDDENKGDIDMIYIDINGNKLELTLENNSATQELVNKLQSNNISVNLSE